MSKSPTHAGCVIFRRDKGRILYLVISSSEGGEWVLPKGHIEPDESARTTVLREAREEAGVTGKIVCPLRIQTFKKPKEEVVVQYFLLQEQESGQAVENRKTRWEDERMARRLLSFADAREVLADAAAIPAGPLRETES